MRPFEVCWKGVEFGSVSPSRKWSEGIPLTFLLHGPNQRASAQGSLVGERFAARMVEHAQSMRDACQNRRSALAGIREPRLRRSIPDPPARRSSWSKSATAGGEPRKELMSESASRRLFIGPRTIRTVERNRAFHLRGPGRPCPLLNVPGQLCRDAVMDAQDEVHLPLLRHLRWHVGDRERVRLPAVPWPPDHPEAAAQVEASVRSASRIEMKRPDAHLKKEI